MSSSLKNPPVFHPDEDDDYASWKKDVSIWKIYTDTAGGKTGAAVYMCQKGKAREVVRSQLKPEEIGAAGDSIQ